MTLGIEREGLREPLRELIVGDGTGVGGGEGKGGKGKGIGGGEWGEGRRG